MSVSRTTPELPGAELAIVDDGDNIQMYDPRNPDASIRAAVETVVEVGEFAE